LTQILEQGCLFLKSVAFLLEGGPERSCPLVQDADFLFTVSQFVVQVGIIFQLAFGSRAALSGCQQFSG
jgi:hypothetical protein